MTYAPTKAERLAVRIERIAKLPEETIQVGHRSVILPVEVAEGLVDRLVRAEHPWIAELESATDEELQLAIDELPYEKRLRLLALLEG